MMHTDPHNVVELAAFKHARIKQMAQAWPPDWAEVDAAPRMRFTLEWLPAWFELAETVAAERHHAAELERRAQV